MNLRPLHDRVIVKRLEEEKKSAGGIIIPDQAAEKPVRGEVLAVGTGKKSDDGKTIALDVKVGIRQIPRQRRESGWQGIRRDARRRHHGRFHQVKRPTFTDQPYLKDYEHGSKRSQIWRRRT